MKLISTLGLCLFFAAPVLAQMSSPGDYTRDGARTLVQKDVNGERWAITYDIASGGVTGNVLKPDGTSTFLDCTQESVNEEGVGLFRCYSSDGCDADRCDATNWSFLTEVELALTFFFPGEPSGPGPSCKGIAEACAESSECCSGLRCEYLGVCLPDDGLPPLVTIAQIQANRDPFSEVRVLGTPLRQSGGDSDELEFSDGTGVEVLDFQSGNVPPIGSEIVATGRVQNREIDVSSWEFVTPPEK